MPKLIKSSDDAFQVLELIYKDKDKDGLWEFIHDNFGVAIPRKAMCEDHDAPFDFVADVFFQKVQNAIALANRTGGKTTDFAILDVLNSYYWPGCETATVGAIEEQAKKCYGYFQDWINKIPIFNERVLESLMRESRFTNGSMVQILTGTMSGVNSPHPQKAFLDEIELMMWNIIQEAFSMPQSKGEILGQLILTSTRKFAFGPMERLLDEAEKRGFKVYRWCVAETIEPHLEEEVKNTVLYEDLKDYYVDGKYPSEGYLKVKDVIASKMRLDEDTWDSQWMCKRPSQKALVYPQFNEAFHVKKTKVDTGGELVLAEDFGFAEGHADVVGFFQPKPSGKTVMVDEIWIEGKTDSDIITMVEDKIIEHGFIPDRYKDKKRTDHDLRKLLNRAVSVWYCPIEEPSKIELRRRAGFKVVAMGDPDSRKVINGLPLVRKALQDRVIIFDPKCKGTIKEMKIYANKVRADGTILDEPAKKNDNGPDMVRYFFINHFPAKQAGHFQKTKSGAKTITAGVSTMEF